MGESRKSSAFNNVHTRTSVSAIRGGRHRPPAPPPPIPSLLPRPPSSPPGTTPHALVRTTEDDTRKNTQGA
eukprot:3386064-Rhodomonas_salina.2